MQTYIICVYYMTYTYNISHMPFIYYVHYIIYIYKYIKTHIYEYMTQNLVTKQVKHVLLWEYIYTFS